MALTGSIQQLILKRFSDTFLGKASRMLGRRAKVLTLLTFVVGRFSEVGSKQGLGAFQTAVRMLRASVNKTYPHLPWRTAVAILGGFLYLASPLDIIPDFLPVLGLLDDAFLLGKIFSLAEKDLRDFAAWEQAQARK